MDIGRKIYYGKSNGLVIWDKGEMTGNVIPTTLEQDMGAMPVLGLLPSEEIGVVEFEYGTPMEVSAGYIVNPKTLTLEHARPPTVSVKPAKTDMDLKLEVLEAKLDSLLAGQTELKLATAKVDIAIK